jgi:translation initiation factor IF-1
MVKTGLSAVLTVIFLIVFVAGCAELLPPGWNATMNETPTGALAQEPTAASETPEVVEEESTPPAETTVAPANKDLPRKTVVEGDLVSFPNLKATDPDGDPIAYTFTPPLNSQGTWQTKAGDAGEYRVTITASDGKNSVSQVVIVQVTPKNRPPRIELTSKTITVKEGDTITLNPTVTDTEGDKITVTYSGWMNSQSRVTTFDDAGTHDVDITASDGTTTSHESVRITVQNVNRQPVINPIQDITVKEGDKITVKPTATDPDGDTVSLSYGSPLGQDGTWQTSAKDVGNYRATVTASDGELKASTEFTIIVNSLNKPPVIQIADTVTVDEGQAVALNPVITDPEGDELTITYSGWMNGPAYTTTFEDGGTHLVTITASDGISTIKKDVSIVVNDVNRVPTFGKDAFS